MSVGKLMNATKKKIAKIFKRVSEGAESDCLSTERESATATKNQFYFFFIFQNYVAEPVTKVLSLHIKKTPVYFE